MPINNPAIVEEVNFYDVATLEQRELANKFAQDRRDGAEKYWSACEVAYKAWKQNERNGWPQWAAVLADKAGLRETDTVRNHLRAWQFYLIGKGARPDLTESLRQSKEYSYFKIAANCVVSLSKKHEFRYLFREEEDGRRVPLPGLIVDLLYDIEAADSIRDLNQHLRHKYDQRTGEEIFSDRVAGVRESLLKLAADGVGYKMPEKKRRWIMLLAKKLEDWTSDY